MSPFALETLLPCVLVPLALLALIAFARPVTRLEAAGLAVAALAGLAAIAGAASWLAFGLWLPVAYGLAGTVLVARLARRVRSLPWFATALDARTRTGITVVLAAVFVGVAGWAQLGRAAGDRAALELQFPLRDGTFLVANGGTTALLNAHVATLDDERYRAWRGQSYGYDLVRVNALGLRAVRPLPGTLAHYLSYDVPVYAPCAGRVLEVVDGEPDRVPPARDAERLPGNFVLLECGEAWVVLAHLRAGSVLLRPNDTVAAGDRLGAIGNSGNSFEPHLHLHAQRPGPHESAFAADPLVITFGGRVLGRNALVRR